MLKSLRNRKHQVITALSIRQEGSQFLAQDLCCSDVRMRDYSDQEIQDYVLSGDPLDKAGSYAIQSPEFDPVEKFSGCFASVMGMPLCHLERTLRKLPDYESCKMGVICRRNIDYECPITQRVLLGEDIG
jgi:predicted house-cleaning NTP pyrophosphatase (Maf/HAM1 superfamily)